MTDAELDAALEAKRSMSDTDLDAALAKKRGVKVGPKELGAPSLARGPSEVNWLEALGNEVTRPIPKGGMVVDNPAVQLMAGHGVVAKGAGVAKELVKDAIPVGVGYAYDKITGGSAGTGSGIGAALLRRFLKKGK